MANLIHNVLPNPPKSIVFIKPEDTIKTCINTMAKHKIGALVVTDREDKLLGIVSERDVIFSCLYEGKDINTTQVQEIVYPNVTRLSPHDEVEAAMQAMTDTRRRHILIYEKEKLIALLSIGDVLFHILDSKAREIEHLEQYITS